MSIHNIVSINNVLQFTKQMSEIGDLKYLVPICYAIMMAKILLNLSYGLNCFFKTHTHFNFKGTLSE